MGGGVCLGSQCFLRAEQEPPLCQTAHLWGRGSQMAGSTFQVPTCSGVGRKCETWRPFPTSSTTVPLHLGSSATICSACLPSVTLFLGHISPVSILWKQELFKSKGDGSGTDDREVMEPPSLEVKKQLARHAAGRMCVEAGGWTRCLSENKTVSGFCFPEPVSTTLLASKPPSRLWLSRYINKCLRVWLISP